jgi:hypothetical protein
MLWPVQHAGELLDQADPVSPRADSARGVAGLSRRFAVAAKGADSRRARGRRRGPGALARFGGLSVALTPLLSQLDDRDAVIHLCVDGADPGELPD